jgi:hypothetical protein
LYTDINLGQSVTAVVRVVSRGDGKPLEGIKVVWQIPGQELPVTTTNADGKSILVLSPNELGPNRLVATVHLGSSKAWEFYVFDPADTPMFERITNLSPRNVVGSEAHVEVRIIDQQTRLPLAHRSVAWFYLNLSLASMRSDANGIAYVKFIFPRAGHDKIGAQSVVAYKELFISVTESS